MTKIDIVYWKDKIGGEKGSLSADAFTTGFTVGPHGEWELLTAKEDKAVKKNELVNLKIEEVELPPKSIAMPCFIMRHALGVVISLAAVGKPGTVEKRRVLDEVIFHPLCDGVVNKGELLCVVNVLHAAVEQRLARGAAEKWLRERYRY